LKILRAEFVTSAAAAGSQAGIPRDGLPQIALAGRSNVGKSSLLNALCRAKIARTSAAPGKTRLANVYRVDCDGGPGGPGRWGAYLVDLPGYGYARGGADAAAELRLVAEAYLAGETGAGDSGRTAPAGDAAGQSRGPRLILLLVDSRHPGLEADLAAGRWIAGLGLTARVVATKVDKLSHGERVRNLRGLGAMFGTAALPVSATSGEGLDELWKTIAKIVRDGAAAG
jgi:GTP-binding protein